MAKKKKTTPVEKPAAPEARMVDEAEPWPDKDGTWTHAQWVAHVRAQQAADDAYVPTAEELAMGARFMKKQESASGYNQVDPNAE